jgi:hypothetical protein
MFCVILIDHKEVDSKVVQVTRNIPNLHGVVAHIFVLNCHWTGNFSIVVRYVAQVGSYYYRYCYYYYYYYYYLRTDLLIAIELSHSGTSPYTSTDRTNKNKYT